MAKGISVIIPAYNEEYYIADTVRAIGSLTAVAEIIVVDDGSKDQTAQRATAAGALVWQNKDNLGKGAALNLGASLARYDPLIFLDADLGATAVEAEKLWHPILAAEADCVIAKLPPARTKGGFGLVKSLANWGVRYYGGQAVPAVLSGQRAFARSCWEKIGPLDEGFGAELGATIRLLRGGFRIKELEVFMAHRETGRNWAGFYHRGKQFKDIIKILIKEGLG